MNKSVLFFARFVTVFAWLLSISFVLIAIWAYGIDRYHPESGKWFDGLDVSYTPVTRVCTAESIRRGYSGRL